MMADDILGERAQTQAGADAFLDLMREIGELSEATYKRFNDDKEGHTGSEDIDGRDYPAMVEAVRASVAANLLNADKHHATGYLRALANLLCITVDGCHPGHNWNPLRSSEAAYTMQRLANAAP